MAKARDAFVSTLGVTNQRTALLAPASSSSALSACLCFFMHAAALASASTTNPYVRGGSSSGLVAPPACVLPASGGSSVLSSPAIDSVTPLSAICDDCSGGLRVPSGAALRMYSSLAAPPTLSASGSASVTATGCGFAYISVTAPLASPV